MRRRKRIRLQGYDYSRKGAYFITICSKDRIEMLGEIVDGEMIMNEHGNIVQSCWDESPLHYPNIQMDEFVVMPDHVHGIIIVDELRPSDHSLGNIVGSFKSAVTKHINEWRHQPAARIWQSRFHDHIIRNERSLNRIRAYIRTNPEHWQWDKKNPICKGKDPSRQGPHDHGTNIPPRKSDYLTNQGSTTSINHSSGV